MTLLPHQRQRAIHAAMCGLSLVAIVVLTVKQTGSGARIVSQLTAALGDRHGDNRSESNFTYLYNNFVAVTQIGLNNSGGVLDPFKEVGQKPPIVYPNLYRSLTRLTQTPGSVASNLISQPAKPGLSPCKGPGQKVLVDLLSKPPSSFPFKTPIRGGFWTPGADCWPPLSRTAVLVPYRNRSKNLELFIPYMHTLLQHQNIVYGIFIIEQANLKLFNRAKLLNIGFKVSQQFGPFDCFVFQDADKVPVNTANTFDCANSPKLMISEIRSQNSKQFKRGRFYHNFFGACTGLAKHVFERVNGNSNRYYGWGREDDELAARLNLRGMHIYYPSGSEARFVNLDHSADVVPNAMPWPYPHKVRDTMDKDGLNSLTYGDKGIFLHDLFVLVRADV